MAFVPAPIPADDSDRLAALRGLNILDSEPEAELDAIVRLAADVCGVPIALISLIDEHRQWFKARVGLDVAETPRDVSFCGHAVAADAPLVVEDASRDPRFAENPLRTGAPFVEFYAGIPLKTASGHAIGTLCVIDHQPRALTSTQRSSLDALAMQAARLIDLRRVVALQSELLQTIHATDEALRAEGTAPPRVAWARWAYTAALCFGVASVCGAAWVDDAIEQSATARMQSATTRAVSFLDARAQAYTEILRGTGALFRASEHVEPRELEAYVDSLQLRQNFPGLVGLGYAERVERANLATWLEVVRRESPDLHVSTSGEQPVLVINTMIEPHVENRLAIGFDIASEPIRADAIAAATRAQELALSRQLALKQDGKPGYVLYLAHGPAGDAPPLGFAFAALRASDVVDGVQAAAGDDVGVRVLDDEGKALQADAAPPPGVEVTHARVPLGDRALEIEVWPSASFLRRSERLGPVTLLGLGLATSLLALLLIHALARTEARSHALAVRMTSALRRGERELRTANEELQRVATTDPLTGIGNRRAFDDTLAGEMARARRSGIPLALVLLDVDCFKLYNDTYGHPQGDACLAQVATCLASLARRAGELAARYGGEEMALVLPSHDVEAAAKVAEKARERLEALALPHARNPHRVVTASFGVAIFAPGAMPDATAFIAAADGALYRAKQQGRNRVERA